ncbi:collagen alpha-1(I) chain-like [Lytechinus pictus]|uniref:collagen alpha-1(I) chain-like n=1 Tax=Lytechinus pictus TaxID=7653 RepID=UPI0030B9B851
MTVILKEMNCVAVLVTVIASATGSLARSLLSSDHQNQHQQHRDLAESIFNYSLNNLFSCLFIPSPDSSKGAEFGHLSPPATVFIILASALCLLTVLALCACGEKPKDEKPPAKAKTKSKSKTRDTQKENGAEIVSPKGDEEVKSSAPNGDPNTTLTQSLSLTPSPPSPNGGAAAAPSPIVDSPSPSNIKRSSTIDRRLPELPPMHSKVPGIPENEENDYNGTYDTIKDDKKKEAGGAGASRKLPSTTDDDPAYNSVEDTMGGASVTRKESAVGGGGAVGGIGALEEDGGDYASVKETSRNSTSMETAAAPSGGAEGGADESDYDGSYAKVKDVQANSNNHPYATVQDKKEREHGYARVKDVHVKPSTNTEGAAGGADPDDEEVPPVPHKPHDLESPENPSSPVSQRAGSMSSPSSPISGRGDGGGSPNPGGGPGGPGGPDGPGPGPDNSPPGAAGPGRKEPPYTQVSARESLESIRARQQQDHTQLTEEALRAVAAAGVAAPPGGPGEQDFDGIYEQVDDNSVRGQNSTSPPPLPRGRQTFPGMGRGRVYEEITEDNRPRPPGASNYDDDPEPYAVVEKTQTEKPPLEASSNSNGNHEEMKGEQKDFDQLYAKVDKTSNKQGKPETHHVNNNNHKRNNSDAAEGEDFGALYAKVEKGRKTIAVMQSHRSPNHGVPRNISTGATPSPNNHAMNSYSDIYADVDDAPLPNSDVRNYVNDSLIAENNYQSIDDDDLPSPSRSPVDEGMVHISEHRPNPDLWVRREHTYQAVEENAKKKKSRHRKSKGDEDERKNDVWHHQPQHSYEAVKPVEGSGAKGDDSVSKGESSRKKSKPVPPTRHLSKEERVRPNLVTVKAKNTNNNHMIESLPVKETRI